MGSEHSTQLQQAAGAAGVADGTGGTLRTSSLHRHSTSASAGSSSSASATVGRSGTGTSSSTGGKLQRGNTIAVTGTTPAGGSGLLDDVYSTASMTPSSAYICDSRPVSPPMSICSDSDLPYISYTDKPIGDSPKLRNKQQAKQAKSRPNSAIIMNRASSQQYHYPQHLSQQLEGRGGVRGRSANISATSGGGHNIVVVKSAVARDVGIEKDDDIVRLQSVPMFLPVMRGTLTLPANRDPEVLERLQPTHLINMCSRLQSHFNTCAMHVSSEQQQITNRIKEVDQEVSSALAQLVQKQKLYTSYAETFSKVHQISQQLTRCNDILNQNIESMDYLNNLLSVDDRLEPFVWKTD